MRNQIILGLVLALTIFSIASVLTWKFFEIISSASDNVKAASVAGLIGVFSLIISRQYEQRKERSRIVNEKKIEIYSRFYKIYFGIFRGSAENRNANESVVEESFVTDLQDFQRDLIFWGSDDVVKAWINVRGSWENGVNVRHADGSMNYKVVALMFAASAKLLKSMRADVGYPYTSIDAQDIAQMMLQMNDPGNQEMIKHIK